MSCSASLIASKMPVKILMSDHGIGWLYDKFATETLGKMLTNCQLVKR